MLGMSGRHFRRLCGRYEEEGVAGLPTGGLASHRRGARRRASLPAPDGLYRERYADFTVKHFHEHLARDHDYTFGLHADAADLAEGGVGQAGGAARGAPQEARAPAAARHAAVPGRLDPSLDSARSIAAST